LKDNAYKSNPHTHTSARAYKARI